MDGRTHGLRVWGAGGTVIAAVFAVWMLVFPDLVGPYFAWPAAPRLGQVFIGAGFIFRTGFFLSVLLERRWYRVRWIYWGNLLFTGGLLLATFLHAEAFNWGFPTAMIWLILYVIEPVLMIYQTPPPTVKPPLEEGLGPVRPALKWVLVLEAAVLGTVGAMLILNPAFMGVHWPWEFKALGGRIMAAWFIGWAGWAGTMAFARDWAEIRVATGLNVLFGVALLGTMVVFWPLFDFRLPSAQLYAAGVVTFTAALAALSWGQESARAAARTLVGSP